MRTPILMVRDPELIKQVLIRDFSHFQENDFHFNPQADPIFAMNPFAATGQKWKDMRAVLAPAQTPAKIKTVIPCTLRVAKNMDDFIERNLGKYINMLDFFGHFTTDVTASWGLGLDINSFKDADSELRVNATNMFGGDFKTNLAILLGFYAPSVGNILGLSMMTDKFVDFFTELVVKVVKERQTSNEKKNDLINMLFEIARDSLNKQKRVMDFQEMAGHALTFFSEGYLTSSFTLTYMLHQLSLNQAIQDRAREEVQRVVDSIHEISYEKLQSLTYMSQIIDETLRLYPTVPMMTRVCTKKTVLTADGRELTVEPGTPVAVSVMGLHRDPKHYDDPTRFDPERFDEEQKASRDRILYLGFSDGPRACVGMRFAVTNLKICLATLLLKYKIKPTQPEERFGIDLSSSFLMMPKNAYIKFEKY